MYYTYRLKDCISLIAAGAKRDLFLVFRGVQQDNLFINAGAGFSKFFSFLVFYSLILLWVAGCKNNTAERLQHNMHGMESMNMETDHDTSAVERGWVDVAAPTNEVVISGQGTLKPMTGKFETTLFADGYIAFDERRSNKVSARFGGRIEKLYVKYNYRYVKKGEKIMELYSPEMITIEEEYIHHLKNISDKDLVQKTKEKLMLLGLSLEQINNIEKTGVPLPSITIYSPYEGYILFDSGEMRGGSANNASMESESRAPGMGMSVPQSESSMEVPVSRIKEGSYVNEGQALFAVNDFKVAWAIVAFSEKDEAAIKQNVPVKVESELTGGSREAVINFIEPAYSEGQKFTQARIYLKNDDQQYKVNSLVTVRVLEEGSGLSIPVSSVFDLGERKIVWVKTGERRFEARNVIAGKERNGRIEIISGISGRDEIAKDAGYLVDSESLIKVK